MDDKEFCRLLKRNLTLTSSVKRRRFGGKPYVEIELTLIPRVGDDTIQTLAIVTIDASDLEE